MALNTSLISSAVAFAAANKAAALRPGWHAANGFSALTKAEDKPEVVRQLLAIRHVAPVSLAGLRGW